MLDEMHWRCTGTDTCVSGLFFAKPWGGKAKAASKAPSSRREKAGFEA
jgi:hypothetical protein